MREVWLLSNQIRDFSIESVLSSIDFNDNRDLVCFELNVIFKFYKGNNVPKELVLQVFQK